MRYKLLGRSGLRVSEICLGVMTFGEEWGFGSPKDESRKVFDAFVEAGGNFFDTANFYTGGTSEKYLGEFIAAERDRHIVATKYTLTQDPADPNACGNHRKSVAVAVEASLKRLGTDYIDLYWVHAWDKLTPIEEVMRGLDDLVRAGKVLYVGVSDMPAWLVAQANTMADLKNWSPFVSLQIEYSLIERTPERDLLPMAKAFDLAVTPWSPLAAGLLTGKYDAEGKGPEGSRLMAGERRPLAMTDRNLAIAQEVAAVARDIGCSAAQVALAWLRGRPYGPVIPIIGARKVEQLKENLGCVDVELGDEHLKRLDEVSRIRLGFPHDFLTRDAMIPRIYGDTYAQLDDHHGRI